MQDLMSYHLKLLAHIKGRFSRPLEQKIAWNERLIALKGARGAGKTTFMLKHIASTFGKATSCLYISLDQLYFSSNSLIDLIDRFSKRGGTHLFIDEVHKYAN